MNLDVRIEQLRHQHSNLDDELGKELARPAPDDLRIRELKLKKLKIKDEIAHLSDAPAH